MNNTKDNETTTNSTSSSTKSGKFSRGKGRHGGRNNSRQNCERIEDKRVANDASWYASNPQLLKDVANKSYGNPLGTKLNLYDGNYSSSTGPLIVKPFQFSGVMTIHTTPAVGISDSAASPVNTAARNIYSYIRHVNSGHTNYDAPDYMMYLLAMDSLYTWYSWLVRIYGLARIYNVHNRYYPKYLVEALGVNFESIIDNLADFRAHINTVSLRIGSLCVPASMPYFQRHAWMMQNVFMDSANAKAQLYMYTPDYVWEYTATAETGTQLLPLSLVTTLGSSATFAAIVAMSNTIISALMEDEDVGVMSGDTLKAFSENGILKVGSITEDYVTVPGYNLEVLQQIQNSIAVGSPMTVSGTSSFAVTQDPSTGVIYYQPQTLVSTTDYGYLGSKFLHSYKDSPEASDTMVWSRLVPAVSSEASVTGYLALSFSSVGSEIVTRYKTWTIDATVTPTVLNGYEFKYVNRINAESPMGVAVKLRNMIDLVQFEWKPQMLLTVHTSDTTPETELGIFNNLNNFTVISNSDLDAMHQVALLSQFVVPLMGAWNSK